MLLELARPVSLLASMLSLLAVFHAAFLGTETDIAQRLIHGLAMLALAAGISLLSGLAFLGHAGLDPADSVQLSRTFPVRIFCWTSGIMAALFAVSWFLETHCIFYRDVRF
jgi:uncharacterized membrane protein YdcZ (DUF606 family)